MSAFMTTGIGAELDVEKLANAHWLSSGIDESF